MQCFAVDFLGSRRLAGVCGIGASSENAPALVGFVVQAAESAQLAPFNCRLVRLASGSAPPALKLVGEVHSATTKDNSKRQLENELKH